MTEMVNNIIKTALNTYTYKYKSGERWWLSCITSLPQQDVSWSSVIVWFYKGDSLGEIRFKNVVFWWFRCLIQGWCLQTHKVSLCFRISFSTGSPFEVPFFKLYQIPPELIILKKICQTNMYLYWVMSRQPYHEKNVSLPTHILKCWHSLHCIKLFLKNIFSSSWNFWQTCKLEVPNKYLNTLGLLKIPCSRHWCVG